MIWTNNQYTITTDKSTLSPEYIQQFLSNQSYWARGIPLETVKKSIAGALCFGVYKQDQQVGFARVITDYATFAYLADVFIDESCRGQGLSKWLMEVIVSHPNLQGLRRFLLFTRDAHGLYEQFNFKVAANPENIMNIHNPNAYGVM